LQFAGVDIRNSEEDVSDDDYRKTQSANKVVLSELAIVQLHDAVGEGFLTRFLFPEQH
jgi:hypothetical protein